MMIRNVLRKMHHTSTFRSATTRPTSVACGRNFKQFNNSVGCFSPQSCCWYSSSIICCVGGKDGGGDNIDGADRRLSDADQRALYIQQMEDMQAEREALFGFTPHDHDAWGNNAAEHKHDADFMEMIDQARQQQQKEEEEENESIVSLDSLTTKTTHMREQIMAAQSMKENIEDPILTHLSQDGKHVNMVDVGTKAVTSRTAVAESKVVFPPEVLQAFATSSSPEEMVGPKGPIFATAKLAGILAAKKTSDLIPLCHPLPLDSVNLDITLQQDGTAWIRCECRVTHKTGVEMEALTGASVAALTIYDMTKAISHDIRIEGTRLIAKRGGKRTVGRIEE